MPAWFVVAILMLPLAAITRFRVTRKFWYDTWSRDQKVIFWVAAGTMSQAFTTLLWIWQTAITMSRDETHRQPEPSPFCVFEGTVTKTRMGYPSPPAYPAEVFYFVMGQIVNRGVGPALNGRLVVDSPRPVYSGTFDVATKTWAAPSPAVPFEERPTEASVLQPGQGAPVNFAFRGIDENPDIEVPTEVVRYRMMIAADDLGGNERVVIQESDGMNLKQQYFFENAPPWPANPATMWRSRS